MLDKLLNHPDFQRGVADAEEGFGEHYDSMLSEDQMIEEVEANLGRHTYKQSARAASGNRCDHPSYIHHLGFVLGTINCGLTKEKKK